MRRRLQAGIPQVDSSPRPSWAFPMILSCVQTLARPSPVLARLPRPFAGPRSCPKRPSSGRSEQARPDCLRRLRVRPASAPSSRVPSSGLASGEVGIRMRTSSRFSHGAWHKNREGSTRTARAAGHATRWAARRRFLTVPEEPRITQCCLAPTENLYSETQNLLDEPAARVLSW